MVFKDQTEINGCSAYFLDNKEDFDNQEKVDKVADFLKKNSDYRFAFLAKDFGIGVIINKSKLYPLWLVSQVAEA